MGLSRHLRGGALGLGVAEGVDLAQLGGHRGLDPLAVLQRGRGLDEPGAASSAATRTAHSEARRGGCGLW